ncbi:AAA family ATPase [Psychroserpens sp. NJDZ02]|uniref:AAA family ATPase n=1 Tax=Psychroserpens sp. NJDZ02 TaxID=2570561 RepID=UPI0010A76A0C|nr:AAA family ATPase [Psychroserpens sp. NJDZ02]QCE42873.1 hypothetical protein E9099_16115 [Psychroserpens sp. NJDZ02]
MKKKNTIEMVAENIGPHLSLNDSFQISDLKLGVFANNGSGKTFISRAFRLINNNSIENVNKILSINKTKGSFKFNVTNMQDKKTQLSIKLNKDKEAVIIDNTDYIFHVFNSDYIKENIEELKYNPDGKIEGYILGRTKIDLTNEKNKLKELNELDIKKYELFKEEVKKAKGELDKQKINKGTSEYKFTHSSIYNNECNYLERKSYNDLVKLNKNLSQTPDDIENIKQLNYSFNDDYFDRIIKIFKTEYTKSKIAQSFKEKVLSKQSFIKEGIKYLSQNLKEDKATCPFCEQDLRINALNLIEQYNVYLDDSESLVNSEITTLLEYVKEEKKCVEKDESLFLKTKNEFDTLKNYIPSLIDVNLEGLKNNNLDKELDNIIDLLNTKILNIEKEIPLKDYSISFLRMNKYLEVLKANSFNNNKILIDFNDKKDNLKVEKLEVNRKLCKAMYLKIQAEQKNLIEEIRKIRSEKEVLEKEIKIKESKEKTRKKLKVLENLKMHLKSFFGEKYSVDDDFCFKFNKHVLTSNATDVLSDGEKSIVAFCYYLADIHKLVDRNDDYDKIFFIIDDPISSLDFHYVYAVAQVIRDLRETLKLKRTRFIILTHNLEFMSILIRNKIIKFSLVLVNSKLSILSRQLIMPYEEHLRDVYNVVKGKESSHTIPNSIRHILETINKFESPDKELKEYCEDNNILKNNEFIYSLMHDASHGSIRQQMPYNDEMIKKGCTAVIDFVNSKFEGQINQIKD